MNYKPRSKQILTLAFLKSIKYQHRKSIINHSTKTNKLKSQPCSRSTPFFPKATNQMILAGLLTCFICAPSRLVKKTVAEDAQIHSEAHSCGYSLGFSPMFPINLKLRVATHREPLSAAKVIIELIYKTHICEKPFRFSSRATILMKSKNKMPF